MPKKASEKKNLKKQKDFALSKKGLNFASLFMQSFTKSTEEINF